MSHYDARLGNLLAVCRGPPASWDLRSDPGALLAPCWMLQSRFAWPGITSALTVRPPLWRRPGPAMDRARASSAAVTGTTSRRPKRRVGISPLAAAAYAASRPTPRYRPASGTVHVSLRSSEERCAGPSSSLSSPWRTAVPSCAPRSMNVLIPVHAWSCCVVSAVSWWFV